MNVILNLFKGDVFMNKRISMCLDMQACIKNSNRAIFKIANADGTVKSLNNQIIMEYVEKYTACLSKHEGKICAIYHQIDEIFVGFVIAAFNSHVKILIRRTSLQNKEELEKDVEFLQKILPVELVLTDNELIECGSYDVKTNEHPFSASCNDEFDFIQLSSGTTDSSKAFCLRLEGLIESARHIQLVHHVVEKSVFLSYLTMSHIYGFVSGFLLPIVSHATGIICKTSDIKTDPSLLFDLLSGEGVTHASVIMSTLQLGLKVRKENWDLSKLECASLGGEKVDISIYESILKEMMLLGMPSAALVNSYGMSEKGSITMEDPHVGNSFYYKGNNGYVSVGNDSFEETEIIIFDDDLNIACDETEGMIGIHSPYIANGFFNQGVLYPIAFVCINGKEYYHNGDCGFVKDNKVYVTGRRINTLTYNGLKIAADVINEHILKLLKEYRYAATRCFCFNYPGRVNYIVCFIDGSDILEDSLWESIRKKILSEYHVDIVDYWFEKYEGHGIGKISLPEIIKKYDDYLKERGQCNVRIQI